MIWLHHSWIHASCITKIKFLIHKNFQSTKTVRIFTRKLVTLIYYPYAGTEPCQLRTPVTAYVSVQALTIASRLQNSTTRFLSSFPNVISNYARINARSWILTKRYWWRQTFILGCYAVSTGKTATFRRNMLPPYSVSIQSKNPSWIVIYEPTKRNIT